MYTENIVPLVYINKQDVVIWCPYEQKSSLKFSFICIKLKEFFDVNIFLFLPIYEITHT